MRKRVGTHAKRPPAIVSVDLARGLCTMANPLFPERGNGVVSQIMAWGHGVAAPSAAAGFWSHWGRPALQHSRWRLVGSLHLGSMGTIGTVDCLPRGGPRCSTGIVPQGLLSVRGDVAANWWFAGSREATKWAKQSYINSQHACAHICLCDARW